MKAKRSAALLLAGAMVFTMLAGCGNKPQQAASSSAGSTSSGTAFKDHLNISIAHWDIGEAMANSATDEVYQTIAKKFNITITPVNITWDDYKTKINTWAAAGTLPDVFSDDAFSETNFSKWATQGVIKALPSDMSAYPNIQKYLTSGDGLNFKYPLGDADGKYYCVPRATYPTVDDWANDQSCMIRVDWMKKVGVSEIPTNMDDFISLMKAFVTKDPDGDGKADTVGLTAYSTNELYFFFNAYEPAITKWTKASDGSWIPGFMTDKAVQGVVALKKLYDAGGLDKDLPTIKSTQGQDKFTSGVAGAYCHSAYPTTLYGLWQDMCKRYGKFNWGDKVQLMKTFKNSDGNYYRLINTTPWSETYFNYKLSDAKLDRTLKLLDWGFTVGSEGFNLVRYGIKGKDYTQDGDKITLIETKDSSGKVITLGDKYKFTSAGNWWGWFQDFSYVNPNIPEDIRNQASEMLNWEKQNCKGTPTNLTALYMSYDGKDKAKFRFKDEMDKALLSKDAGAEWKQMVADYKKNGYDAAIAGYNKAAQALKITDVTEK